MKNKPIHSLKVKDIYDAMVRRGLVLTKADFSSHWLCLHWTYYSIMSERVTQPALLSLWERLQAAGHVDLAILVFGMIRERTITTPAPGRYAHRQSPPVTIAEAGVPS